LKQLNLVAVVFFASLSAAACLADTPPPPAAGAPQACKQDMQSLCPDVKPGEGRIGACMKAHAKELSAGCKQAIREKRREQRAAEGASGTGSPPASASPPSTNPPQ
jgi:hypothetical protein